MIPSPRPLALYAAYALLILSFFLGSGYCVYCTNHAHQIPLVNVLNDPRLYQGDPFRETLVDHPSLFWRGVAVATRGVPLETLLFGLWLIEKGLLIAALISLTRALGNPSRFVEFCVLAFVAMVPQPIIGTGTMTPMNVEQTGFSIPFYLLAIASFLRNRPWQTALCFAVGWNLNSLYGIFAASYLAAAALTDRKWMDSWKSWVAAAGAAAILMLPATLLSARASSPRSGDDALWLAMARGIFPYHLFVWSMSGLPLTLFVAFAAACVAILARFRTASPFIWRLGLAWCMTALGWIAYASVAERTQIVGLIMLQPLRAPDLWYFMGSLLSLRLLADSVSVRRWAAPALLGLVLFWRPNLLSVLLYLLSAPILAFVTVAWRKSERQYKFAIAAILLAAVCASNLAYFLDRVSRFGGIVPALYMLPPEDRRELAAWGNEHTPPDAVFFVDPNDEMLRGLLRRPIFLTIKDAGNVFWNRAYAKPFTERLAAYGVDIRADPARPLAGASDLRNHWFSVALRTDAIYRNMRDPDVMRLKQAYRLDYWAVPIAHPSYYPEVWRGGKFKILDITGKPALPRAESDGAAQMGNPG